MEKGYVALIASLKKSIVESRYVAAKLVNKEQLRLYLKIGGMLSEKIAAQRWGAKVLERIAEDLQKQLPGLRGFSSRNLNNMRQFYEGYREIVQTVSAEMKCFWRVSFSHHMLLIIRCKTLKERLFYIEKAAGEFWSFRTLEHHVQAKLFKHKGKLSNNFKRTLPKNLKTDALEVFKDDYLFDFVATDDCDERVLEGKLVADIKNMIMTLGKGLKRGKFMPAYAGQLGFYLNVLDEQVRLDNENPSIGIILCKEKKNTVVEFAVKSIDKAMGVATYRTTKEMPRQMRGILPDVKEMAKLL